MQSIIRSKVTNLYANPINAIKLMSALQRSYRGLKSKSFAIYYFKNIEGD